MRDEAYRRSSGIQRLQDRGWGRKCRAHNPQPILETFPLNFHSSHQQWPLTSCVPGPTWDRVISQCELREGKGAQTAAKSTEKGFVGGRLMHRKEHTQSSESNRTEFKSRLSNLLAVKPQASC